MSEAYYAAKAAVRPKPNAKAKKKSVKKKASKK